MTAYYNEIDPYAAQWLRNLIEKGLIAPGVVDERSIEDVKPDELMGYTQCHFFAGIGVWSLALRRAGWPDNRPIWTGSCPCQPFSSAGKGSGFDDERHLWPHFQWLIQQCKPSAIAGEQVASKDAAPWLDLVQADLEALGYAFGAVAFPSAGVGAPHIRDRAYWVGNAGDQGLEERFGIEKVYAESSESRQGKAVIRTGIHPGGMANGDGSGREQGSEGRQAVGYGPAFESDSSLGSLADRNRPGPTNGFWRDADWLLCRDEKWRPVKPGSFPLADGVASRVGRLRAYGNAINAEAATVFIQSVMESLNTATTSEAAA